MVTVVLAMTFRQSQVATRAISMKSSLPFMNHYLHVIQWNLLVGEITSPRFLYTIEVS